MKVSIENWAVIHIEGSYSAPELQIPRLEGNVYGHERFGDGKGIVTSRVVGREGDFIVTISGTRYKLGAVKEEYEKLFPNAKERLMKQLEGKEEKRNEEDKKYIKELESALFDVLDGCYMHYEIRANTGLPEDRCKEIEELYKKITPKHF